MHHAMSSILSFKNIALNTSPSVPWAHAHALEDIGQKVRRMANLCKGATNVIFSLHKCLTHAYADIQYSLQACRCCILKTDIIVC